MTDKIAAAIAAAEATPPPVEVVSLTVTLSTGRQVGLLVPIDFTTREALDTVNFVAVGLGKELEKRRNPASRIVPVHLARG